MAVFSFGVVRFFPSFISLLILYPNEVRGLRDCNSRFSTVLAPQQCLVSLNWIVSDLYPSGNKYAILCLNKG